MTDQELAIRLRKIFLAVLEKQPEQRAAFLDGACGEDAELRAEVESLLFEHSRQAGSESAAPHEELESARDDEATGDRFIGGRLGRYRIVRKLGQGGMGTVYKAEDPDLCRSVALKVLPRRLASDPKGLERFKREARSAAALSHPNVVTLYSVEEDSGTHFLTMELVRGEPLDRLIPTNGLDLAEIFARSVQLAEGLRAAHEHGIVHRDLKPANVIVDSDARLRILDFGLAKLLSQEPLDSQLETSLDLTVQGTVVGTVPYMSPEQVAVEPLDHRSDIFSFGTILYQMCTGRRPFAGESLQQVMSAILRDEPASPKLLRGDLPESLERIVLRCLEKEPSKRFQTARELHDALDGLRRQIASDPRATLDSGSHPGSAPSRRVRAGVAILGVIGALALLGVWGASWLRDTATPPPDSPAISSQKVRKLVAVMPLRNLGPVDDEFFAAGITEEIITRLATVKGLGIVSTGRSTPFRDTDAPAKEIGAELGVDFVLSGSVRWARQEDGPSRIRISPRLIRVEDNLHLWAEAYDRSMEDIFEIQSEIALSVANALGQALLEPDREAIEFRPTDNQDAYQAYLRGRFAPTSVFCDDIRSRTSYLRRAVELDPSFTKAWTALSQGYAASYSHCPEGAPEDRRASKEALARAEQIAPDTWEVQVARAQYLTQVEGDYRQAIEMLERASEQVSTNEIYFSLGRAYRRLGRWDEALSAFERAAELDPGKVDSRLHAVHMWMRNYERAIHYLDLAFEAAPTVNSWYSRKAWAYWLWKGDTPEARATLEVLPASEPSMLIQWAWFWQRVYERRYQEAIDGLDLVPDEPLMGNDIYLSPKPLLEAQALDLMGESGRSRAAYERAVEILEGELRKFPNSPKVLQALAIAYAGTDRKEAALRSVTSARSLVPVETEPYFGCTTVIEAALVCTMVDEYDRALDALATCLAIPAVVSIPWLRLDPRWAPLLEHPRFKELAEQYG